MTRHTIVRIPCRSCADATELALRLEADEYRVARHLRTVLAYTESREQAEVLADKLNVDLTAGNGRVWRSSSPGPLAVAATVPGNSTRS